MNNTKAEVLSLSSERKILNLVLIPPFLLGLLLLCTGGMGIFLSKNVHSQIKALDKGAVSFLLVFNEIRNNIQEVTVGLLEFSDLSKSAGERTKVFGSIRAGLLKISKNLSRNQLNSKGQPYEGYFIQWTKDWMELDQRIVGHLQSREWRNHSQHEGIVQAVRVQDGRIDNINSFIQADVTDRIEHAKQFSEKTSLLLGIGVTGGLFLSAFATFFLVLHLKRIFSRQHQTDALLEEQRSKIINTSKMSALGEMAGGVAHEINNPLASIKNLLSQLQEVVDDDPLDKGMLKDMALTAEKTTDRITKIVLGLRSFSRDGGRDPFRPVNVHQLVEETISFCNERFKNRGIRLDVENFDPKLAFEGRATQISQVLLNLLNNAHDAIVDLKEKWIKISAREHEDSVEIRVTDCGGGISSDVQEKLFQPFFTTKEIGKGTGLGLSISTGIVQDHRGQLTVDSQCPNTCFVIRLPKKQAATTAKAA